MLLSYLRLLLSAGLMAVTANLHAACEPTGKLEFSLSVTSPMVSIADRSLRVQVYGNGCVAIHQPAFYRAAGNYRLALSSVEQTQLRQSITAARIQQVDQTALRLAGSAQAAGGRLERFEVVDADIYVLEVGAGDSAVKLSHAGLLAEAELLPENADLQSLKSMVQDLLALASRADAVKVSAP